MKLIINPSDTLIERAKGLGFKLDEKALWYLSEDRIMGLMNSYPFEERTLYLGTISFCKGKIRKNNVYDFFSNKRLFYGDRFKTALHILGKKRVRIFMLKQNQGFNILMLGTKEGTVAIAPIIPEDSKWSNWKYIPIQEITKKPTTKMLRGSIFGQIFERAK